MQSNGHSRRLARVHLVSTEIYNAAAASIPIPLASHMEILTICLGSAKRYSVPSAKMSLPQDALPAELHACRGRSVPESNWEDRRGERSLEIRLISAGRTPSSKCG